MASRPGIHEQEPARLLGAARLPRRGGSLQGDALLVDPLVTLTSDFGTGSPYVAAMKAAVLAVCPTARLLDISHSIPPFDVRTGSFVLWAATRDFPEGTVHLAVVDPGVGGARRPVAIAVGGSYFVGPDNGLFSTVLRDRDDVAAVELARPAGASATFEGRDVFAPAAGRLASGSVLAELGAPAPQLVTLPAPGPSVLWVDNFGNLVTSLRPPVGGLRVGGRVIRESVHTFSDASPGVPFWYVGSLGLVEIGVREGSAAALLGVRAGTAVEELPAP